jgi:hypothetical protein
MLSQVVSAALVQDPNVVSKTCGGIETSSTSSDKKETTNVDEAAEEVASYVSGFEMELEEEFAKSKESSTTQCGTKNSFTQSLEKGDCTAEGFVITEITEPVGPAVQVGEDKIIDVYAGICCLMEYDYGDDKRYCGETRTVYYADYDGCEAGAAYCERRQWLISSTGAGLIKTYLKQIYIFGAGIGGFIAVTIIVASGIQISVSGVTGDITAAKDRIIQSITGLVLLFLSGLILYTINPTFFG